MFPMTVTVSSRAELHAVMSALADTNAYAQAKAIHAEPLVGKMTFTTAEGKKPKAGAPIAPAPAQIAAAAAPTAESPDDKTPTYDEVASAVRNLAAAHGARAAVKVLAQFGATKATELKPSQYAAVRAAIEEVLLAPMATA